MKYAALPSLFLLFIIAPLHTMQEIKVVTNAPAQEELKSPLSGNFVLVEQETAEEANLFEALPFFNTKHFSSTQEGKIQEEKKETISLPIYGPQLQTEQQEIQAHEAASEPTVAGNISDFIDDFVEKHNAQIGIIIPLIAAGILTKLYIKLSQAEW